MLDEGGSRCSLTGKTNANGSKSPWRSSQIVGHDSVRGPTGTVATKNRAMQEKLLSLDEVATTLGTSRAWVRDHATRRNPRISVVRLGGKRAILRFRPADLETFIKKHLVSSEESA